MTTIADFAFNNLKELHFKGFFPDSYGTIFWCKNLSVMSLNDPVPPTVASNVFASTKYRSGILYVPDRAVETYSSTSPWYAWGEIRPISKLKLDGDTDSELVELQKAYATLQENYDKIANELAEQKQANATLQSSNESMAKELADQKALASKLQSDYENAEKELASLKQTNATLQSNNESMAKELEALKSTHATLLSNYDNISKELTAYKLGDLNGDGVTDILDVEALIKLSSYSSSESALATLVEETGITLTEISEQYGDVEFYTLDGKKVSKPSQNGVYIVKKNGQTKMIVVKK